MTLGSGGFYLVMAVGFISRGGLQPQMVHGTIPAGWEESVSARLVFSNRAGAGAGRVRLKRQEQIGKP